VFWVISVYFNIRNILPRYYTFLPGPPVYVYIYMYIYIYTHKCKYATLYISYPCVKGYLYAVINQEYIFIIYFIIYYSETCFGCFRDHHQVAYCNTERALQDRTTPAFTAGLITGHEPRVGVQNHNGLAEWQL
jgi:hypothetical protein